ADIAGEIIRQEVYDPDHAAPVGLGEHLHRGAVMLEALVQDRVDQPPVLVVAAHQSFARDRTADECDDPYIVALKLALTQKAGGDTPVHRAEVAQRVPHALWRSPHRDFIANGGHFRRPHHNTLRAD